MTTTIPVPHTFVAGDDATSSVMQTLTDAILFLLGSTTSTGARRNLCRARQAVAQSIANNTWTALNFDTEDVDYDSCHSTATNTDRFTAQATGWYHVDAIGTSAPNATGDRGVRLTVNGALYQGTQVDGGNAGSSDAAGGDTGGLVFLTAGDILRVEVLQVSGGALNTSTAAQSSVSIEWRSN